MVRTIEAATDADGHLWLGDRIEVGRARRALLMILDEPPTIPVDVSVLSEAALAEDWLRHEEDEAWSHLQQDR